MIGAIAVGLFSYKSWLSWRHYRNQMSKYFAQFGFFVSLSLAAYGFWPWFGVSEATGIIGYRTGDVLLLAALLVQSRLLWDIVLEQKIHYGYILALTLTLGLPPFVLMTYVDVTMNVDGAIAIYNVALWAEIFRGLLFVTLLLPVGYYFMKRSLRAHDLAARAKSFTLGATYFGVGVLASVRDIFGGGADTFLTSTLNIILFSIFGVTMFVTTLLQQRRLKVS